MPIHPVVASVLSATLLFAASALRASEPVEMDAGETRSGPIETRNSSIRIGDEASVDGNVISRNGSIRIGHSVSAGDITSRNGSVSVGNDGQFGNIGTRNGSIRLGDNVRAGDVDSRNGAINIGPGAVLRSLNTRNGAITIGDQARVETTIQTRNGAIRGGEGVHVSGDVTTRNGDVRWMANGQIDGSLTTRNGKVELDRASVGRHLSSRGGDLTVRQSKVGGDVIIEVNDASESGGGWLWFGRRTSYGDAGSIRITHGSEIRGDVIVRLPDDYDGKAPVVEIDSSSRVHGRLRVDRRVRLKVDGEVMGGTEPI